MLQVFCGMLARIEQFVDVFRDSREQLKKVYDLRAQLQIITT